MADSLRNGEVEMRRSGETSVYNLDKTNFPASPFHPFAVSQKVWYDQALTRMGGEA